MLAGPAAASDSFPWTHGENLRCGPARMTGRAHRGSDQTQAQQVGGQTESQDQRGKDEQQKALDAATGRHDA